MKAVPGRKTDVKDCEWLAQLLEHGLLRASFIPPPFIRELRDLTGTRTGLREDRSSLQVTDVLSKVAGGQLARLAPGLAVVVAQEDVAFTGNWR